MSISKSKNILERLDAGEVVIGDGSYCSTLEKRGYVKAGCYTPESSVEHPAAVEALAEEFSWAGADITQTFTYYSRDVGTPEDCSLTCQEINQASCDIARRCADKWGTIVAGGIVQTAAYRDGLGKEEVHKELREGLEVLIHNNIDLIIVEYFHNIEEMEWAIELALSYDKPVAATMCMGPCGDGKNTRPGECAVRMARAGAKIIGVNCLFDPFLCIETLTEMKAALDEAGLSVHMMAQPLGYRTPDVGRFGWVTLPEFPYAMEPRQITRWEAARFARAAYELGVRVIGGCCGFESHHIKAMAEELAEERGVLPAGSVKSDYGFEIFKRKAVKRPAEFGEKCKKEYWQRMEPSTGRPMSRPFCQQEQPTLVNRAIFQ